MAFWDLFKSNDNEKNSSYKHGLYQKSKELFPDADENELIKWTCISGLLARVAYSDLNIDQDEINFMSEAISQISEFDKLASRALVDLTVQEIQTLAGQENHRYCYELNELVTDNTEKFAILKMLFAVAAADGEVESVESEEIRNITKALLLEHKHYISAQATVRDKLRSLK